MGPDIAHDPIAIGSFGAIGIVVIPQDLSNLIHEPEFRIRSDFFEFSMLSTLGLATHLAAGYSRKEIAGTKSNREAL